MSRTSILLLVPLVATLFLTPHLATAKQREQVIPLSKVPKVVRDAATKAAKGITLTRAEVERTRRGLVYDLQGMAGGKVYEIEVTYKGRVLKIETEDDGDDDDDDDDDGDDDD